MERLFAGGVLNLQLLIIVAVQGVECVCVIDNDIEQRAAILGQFLLVLYGATQHLDRLAQLVVFLRGNSFVNGVALQEVLFQNLISPDAECSGILGVNTIAYRKNCIKVIVIDNFKRCTSKASIYDCFHFGNCRVLIQFAGCEDVLKVF